jgi:lipopolysaccharide export system protein LptA
MTVCLVLALLAASAASPFPGADFKHPVEINSDHLEIVGKKNQAIWVGHVQAQRGTTHLSCQRLVAYYTTTQEISKLECLGNVEVTDGDKWAKGERADFDNLSGVLDVTGSPEARQGKNHMRGTKVTFHVDSDVIEVKNAVTLFESSAQRPPPLPKKKAAP